jgi:RNA polymerase sigma factor (TIGR02999 family)
MYANPTNPKHAESMDAVMTPIGEVLSAIDRGDPHAAEELLPLVYDELHKLAAHKMAKEKVGHTLQTTALVHEAYLRLVVSESRGNPKEQQSWKSRGHFFAAAAEAMRRILVERARHRQTLKAGGGHERISLSDAEPATDGPGEDVLALHEALEKLAGRDLRKAELVKLRYFAGLTMEQAAEVLGISTSTADNDWAYARAWLRLELSAG